MSETLIVSSESPSYTAVLPRYTSQTVVHPDTFNPVHQALLDNDAALANEQDSLRQQAQELAHRLGQVEQTSAVDVSRSVHLDWLYRDNLFAIELFGATTIVAHHGVRVLSGIAGDDSLDLENTSGLVVGGDYLLMLPPPQEGGSTAERVRVAAILNSTRVRLTHNLSLNHSGTSTLGGSTLTPRPAGGVRAEVGAQWVSMPINMGASSAGRSVIIRRSLSAGNVRLFCRDNQQIAWSECLWSTRRSTTAGVGEKIPAGFADYEYIVNMQGEGCLRIEIDGEPVDILHIVVMGRATGLGGEMNPEASPGTPHIAHPVSGAQNITERLILSIDGYASPANHTFAFARFQLSLSSDFASLLHDSGDVASMSYKVPTAVLQVNTQLYVRCRVKDVAGLLSEWSAVSNFKTAAQFAHVLGIVLTSEGGGAGTWQRVNEDFQAINANAATFANHPIYTGIVDQVIDGQAMVKIPKFYYRCIVVPEGPYEGKRCWQVSNLPQAGFEVHPAFMKTGQPIEQFWLGKYLASVDGEKMGSLSGVNVISQVNLANAKTKAAARNVAGVSGFGVWNVYQLSAIKLLCMIEMGGVDSQALIGDGLESALFSTSGADHAVKRWRGLTGIFGSSYQLVDGLEISAGNRFKVWDKHGNQSFQTTLQEAPALAGVTYTVSLSYEATESYDLSALFLPAVSSPGYFHGTLADAFSVIGSGGVAAHGGRSSYGSKDAGLFNFIFFSDEAGNYVTSRLAKI